MDRTLFTPAAALAVLGGAAGLPAAHAQHWGPACGTSGGLFAKKDCPGRHANPVFDSRYIKKYCGPTVNCESCFGFYRTQWRSWAEACNEPEPETPGPVVYPPAAPAAEVPAEEAKPKAPEPKAVDPGRGASVAPPAGLTVSRTRPVAAPPAVTIPVVPVPGR
jgi:hypothetical protein